MTKYIIDCKDIQSKVDFWNLYLEVVDPDGAEYFGKNLDALWDALHAGGPGFPGEEECTIKVINTATLKQIEDGIFYDHLKQISYDLKSDPGCQISFKVE
ncbi:barstar family protein [Methylomonas sp. HYX-M1]|uniref:barstar family protein n=1 Tax=Methylomonas sp. HYX-M1 TaxID=3139307 RepID=UPI00345BD4C9